MKYEPVLDLCGKLEYQRYLVVGDIHGCWNELDNLLNQLNFNYNSDVLICVGDLIDRGPDSLTVYLNFLTTKNWYSVMGNHDDRFRRYLQGRNVKQSHGLVETIKQFTEAGVLNDVIKKKECLEFFSNLPYIIKVPDGYIVHGGFYPNRLPEEQTREDCIFSRYFGGKDYFDHKLGRYWYKCLPDNYPTTFSGHEVHEECSHQRDHYTISTGGQKTRRFEEDWLLDGGCVFGGELRIWDSKDDQVHSIKALKIYSESSGPSEKRLERSAQHFYENKDLTT